MFKSAAQTKPPLCASNTAGRTRQLKQEWFLRSASRVLYTSTPSSQSRALLEPHTSLSWGVTKTAVHLSHILLLFILLKHSFPLCNHIHETSMPSAERTRQRTSLYAAALLKHISLCLVDSDAHLQEIPADKCIQVSLSKAALSIHTN